MKIIQVHNHYLQPGGEESVVQEELALLKEHGHAVSSYAMHNTNLKGWKALVTGSLKSIWNWSVYREFRIRLQQERPDIVHCHNIFPQISPSIYWACRKEGVPVVQTLHNYRLLCLNAFLFRQHHGTKGDVSGIGSDVGSDPGPRRGRTDRAGGAICELCAAKRFKWPGVIHRCYRQSVPASLVVALILFVHTLLRTWSRMVCSYIVLTEFQKDKLCQAGLDPARVRVKPNFVRTSDAARRLEQNADERQQISRTALYVGRLSPEKGGVTLLMAWREFSEGWIRAHGEDSSAPALMIVGDGPERMKLEAYAHRQGMNNSVHFAGRKSREEVYTLMRDALFLVSPSICYETFGMVVIEAGMQGTPSIVGEPGAASNLIEDGQTGLLYPLGDSRALAAKLRWAYMHPEEMAAMGQRVKGVCQDTYSQQKNYEMLMEIYNEAISLGGAAG